MKKGTVTLRSHHKADNATSLADMYERYFDIGPVYFRDDFDYAFIGLRRYKLAHRTFLKDEVLMVSLEDVRKVFAQTFTFTEENGICTISHNGISARLEAGTPIVMEHSGTAALLEEEIPYAENSILYVPLEGLMKLGFGMVTDWQKSYLAPGDYLGISEQEDIFPDIMFVRQLAINADKSLGNLSECYYYEDADSLMPYRLYIPSGYSPEKPSRLLVYLHGATPKTNPDRDIDKTNGQFERICDAHNTILLACDGYAEGMYGGRNLTFNFDGVTEEERHYLHLCENEVLSALKHVQSCYNIDPANIFLMGNSMGGAGTLWLGNKYPQIWNSLIPCGCLTGQDPYQFDFSGLKNKDMLLVCGTENIGYAGMKECTAKLCTLDIRARLLTVGGGLHENAWIIGLPEIFAFIEAQTK